MQQHHINVADATFAFIGYLQNVNADRLLEAGRFRRRLLALVPPHLWPKHQDPDDTARPIEYALEMAMERMLSRSASLTQATGYCVGAALDTIPDRLVARLGDSERCREPMEREDAGKATTSPRRLDDSPEAFVVPRPASTALMQRDRTS